MNAIEDLQTLTRTLSSGKPPSVLRSQTSFCSSPDVSQTRNLPAVSSAFRGKSVIEVMAGEGKDKKSSVWIHVARCSLRETKVSEVFRE